MYLFLMSLEAARSLWDLWMLSLLNLAHDSGTDALKYTISTYMEINMQLKCKIISNLTDQIEYNNEYLRVVHTLDTVQVGDTS